MVQHIQDIHPELITPELRSGDRATECRRLAFEITELASVMAIEVEDLQYALVFGPWQNVQHHLLVLGGIAPDPRGNTDARTVKLINQVAANLTKRWEAIDSMDESKRGGWM